MKILNKHDIPFDAADQKIICYGHIVNLCLKRVIDKLTNDSELDDFNSDADDYSKDHVPMWSQVLVMHVCSII